MTNAKTILRQMLRLPILKTIVAPLKRWRATWGLGKATERGANINFVWPTTARNATLQAPSNPLREFFDSRKEGPGIWKWTHYFDIYDRHFHPFRGQEVHVLEIGVYSGGSLDMWRNYFGPNATIYGVDIESDCRAYENDGIKIFIGDQADRSFWREFRRQIPTLDIVIDDGGHKVEQQIVTLEELLPFLRPGGVYFCEDVHGMYNAFASYIHGLGHKLNESKISSFPDDADRRLVGASSPFQSAVGSINLYPFVTVLERNKVPLVVTGSKARYQVTTFPEIIAANF